MLAHTRRSLSILHLPLIGVVTSFFCLAQDASLSLSPGSAVPGTTVPLDLSLAVTSADPPASLEWVISYSTSDFSAATVQAGPMAVAANKAVSCSSLTPGTLICVLYGLNTTPISNGVVATASLTLSSSTTATASAVQLSNGMGADAVGGALAVVTTGNSIGIIQPALNGFTCLPISL